MKQTTQIEPPSRVNYNFLDKCNMNCRFCYVPFDGCNKNSNYWFKIIDYLYEWKIESITFSGGDPFLHKGFLELLKYTYEKFDKKIFIQVDTNGMYLSEKQFDLLKKSSVLLGLSLEGATPETCYSMRGNKNLFSIIIGLLNKLCHQQIDVKINTLVCKKNIHEIGKIAELLRNYPIKIWSLYEFWPLGSTAVNNIDQFYINNNKFITKTQEIKQKYEDINIEIGSVKDRWKAYFFVSESGKCYSVDLNNKNRYVDLGLITDKQVLYEWSKHANLEDNQYRFKKRIKKIAQYEG